MDADIAALEGNMMKADCNSQRHWVAMFQVNALVVDRFRVAGT